MKFTFAPESRPLDGFTIKRAIARGGFGEVYYALTDSGKEVAIKLLQDNLEVELRGVTQCLNLKHPNLVTLFDIKQDADGDHWIVMEYVGGKTLDRVIHENPNGLPLDEVLAWLDGLAAGIGFLHDRGIVHRDLKPANIFRENGIVKVGDVGLSKFIAPSRRSAHTQSVGTVYYMAPEVAKGRYGREVDVYSLAIILYELLTGKVPFDGETTAEILMKHLTERPNLDPIAPNLRPAFEAALEKDPQRRTHDVVELARQFRELVTGVVSIEPHPLPILEVDDSPRSVPVVSRAERFPRPKRPASRWEKYCRSAGETVGSVWRLPLWIKAAAIVVALMLIWPRALSAGGLRFGSTPAWYWVFFGMFACYAVFQGVSRGVDWLFLPVRDNPPGGLRGPTRTASLNPVNSPASRSSTLRNYNPNSVRPVNWRRRITELSGSLAAAGLATTLITGVLAYVTQFFGSTALIGHFAAGTLLGSWALLTMGKLREGLPRERYVERLLLGGVGVLVGIAMFQLDEWLLLELPMSGWSQKQSLLAMTSVSVSGNPQQMLLASYVAFFGTLFALRRWWWQADSYRSCRFRVMSVLLTTLIGWIAAKAWGFPDLWGAVWAASLSSVVQLAAVWTPPHERK